MFMRKKRLVVVLLNWNGYRDTLECLDSLQKITSPPFDPIVVDNGSSDGSVEKIRARYPDLPIFETKQNLGFAGGNNVGIEWALRKGAEWILLLNNDTTVAPDLLEKLLAAAKEKPNGKIFGAKIYRYSDPERIDHLGGFWREEIAEFTSPASGALDHPYFEMEQVDYVCGAALFFHRSVVEKVGLLEPKFFLFWEETDFCFRARRAGFEVWTVPEARVWHKVSASFTGGKPHTHYFWWRSRLLWIERNCSKEEKKRIYRKVIWPELWKGFRHWAVKSLVQWVAPNEERKRKIARDRAGWQGALDYWRGRFGGAPEWVIGPLSKPKEPV